MLPLDEPGTLTNGQHIVEQKDERLRDRPSAHPLVVNDKSCLSHLEEVDQLSMAQVPSAPDHEYRRIAECPLESLHGCLDGVASSFVSMNDAVCFLYSLWALVEQVHSSVGLEQKAGAETPISSSYI